MCRLGVYIYKADIKQQEVLQGGQTESENQKKKGNGPDNSCDQRQRKMKVTASRPKNYMI